MRFGKLPAQHDYRTLRFGDYVPRGLVAPQAHDSLAIVQKHLGAPVTALYPMLGNDQYGDCTCAALGHAETLFSGLIGAKAIPTTAQTTKLYFSLTGGVDSGLVELDVLNAWRKKPLLGGQILAYVKVNAKNHAHVQLACAMFGSVYLGFQVQAHAIADFNARKPWTPGPLTQDGHAVLMTSYTPKDLTVLTWGNTQKATWAWWDECVEEAYCVLPVQAQQSGFSQGFNFAQLTTDLAQVAGS